MLRRLWSIVLVLALAGPGWGCHRDAPSPDASSPAAAADPAELLPRPLPHDAELLACRERIAAVRSQPGLPGAPQLDALRGEILGRALGEPMVFVEEPQREIASEALRKVWEADLKSSPLLRVGRWRGRYRQSPAELRQLVLRQGYLYSTDPIEAYALVRELFLTDMFREPEIWLQRGRQRHRLVRQGDRQPEYRFATGPRKGAAAKLLFGDRLALTEAELDRPLHRDVKALADELGFDRMRITHRTQAALVAELRFGGHWVPALLESEGAALKLGCLAAPAVVRQAALRWQQRTAWQRRAMAELERTVQLMVDERLPFDRPRGVKDHLSDGQLRPLWNYAYQAGRTHYGHKGEGYLIFDAEGRPAPPQMCVELIVDSYERAAGTWYRKQGEKPERVVGKLDFNAFEIPNRAGVLAFEIFAQSRRDLFTASRFTGPERIPFQYRQRFFQFLLDHADRFQAGDIVAIQGPKPDGYVHQHAILIVAVDPVSGFPYALADHMKYPRHRTWEMIMAEAPQRSLLYHIRPTKAVLAKLDPQAPG